MNPYPLSESLTYSHRWRVHNNSTKGLENLCKCVLDLNVETNEICVVEVGCAAGESTWILRHYFDLVFCVDIWEYEGFETDYADKVYEGTESAFDYMLTRRCGGVNGYVTKIKGLSAEVCKSFDRKFELVYIDADHSYDSVCNDISGWLPLSTRFIGGHDYERDKHNEVIQAVNDTFGTPDYVFEDFSWLVDLTRVKWWSN